MSVSESKLAPDSPTRSQGKVAAEIAAKEKQWATNVKCAAMKFVHATPSFTPISLRHVHLRDSERILLIPLVIPMEVRLVNPRQALEPNPSHQPM